MSCYKKTHFWRHGYVGIWDVSTMLKSLLDHTGIWKNHCSVTEQSQSSMATESVRMLHTEFSIVFLSVETAQGFREQGMSCLCTRRMRKAPISS